ncbi:tetratricopeptide repeat (TPR)-like superfamily protein [Tasmannia lanceolata]|uniref:tetratricopeptide repeat (TPR)-like superfamily protein n=1 Tax=Tasmannia lanceolata TaxID=3420 RepID=UPI0040627CB7
MTLYMPIFRFCTTIRTLLQLHAHLLISGHQRDALAATKLIESYAKMGSIQSARWVFDTFSKPDSFMWGVLIKSYVWNLFFKEAISLYHEMQYNQPLLSSFIFPSVLRACSSLSDVGMGAKIHGRIVKSGFESDHVVETALLHMYGEMANLENARRVFDEMSQRDVVSWSSIVLSYVKNGRADKGLEIFSEMNLAKIEPDSVMMSSVVQACAELGFLKQAKLVHGYIVRRVIDISGSLANSLVAMYSKCGGFDSAEKLFKKVSERSVVSWTAMISCYNQRARFKEALENFLEMRDFEVKPNSVTMVGVIMACAQLGWLKEGMSVHGFVIRNCMDPNFDLLGAALIDMYAGCGKIRDCWMVFETIQEKTLVSWNSIITVYAQSGFSEEALTLFVRMLNEGLFCDSFTLASSLSACSHIGFCRLGSQIHGHIAKIGFENNEFVQNSLINMYCKCGLVDMGHEIFDEVKEKGVITWNSMIGGFAQNGNSVEAVMLFDRMHSGGLDMDRCTFVNAIQACSHLGFLEKGKWFHHKVITYGLEKDNYVDTALVNMYGKCGDIKMARRVFDNMTERSVVSWSAMISGYGIHGQVDIAIFLFTRMIDLVIKPNEVTFLSLLSACSHSGSVKEGEFYFDSMSRDFHIKPNLEHCACMVDLLSRAGHLDRAWDFINSMPTAPNGSIWGALLNGCRIHRRMDMIGRIQRSILDLEPNNSGYYTLLSNVHAQEGNWDGFGKVRLMMKNMGLRKVPGYSTIELNKCIHRFSAGDTSHPQNKEIYSFLEGIESLAQEQGYMSYRVSHVLSADKCRKEQNVRSHSEKLALAFGIINTSPEKTLHIYKNLRVCDDCHTFTKFVSMITIREIIMRDLNRFHHFKNGSCSCGDYW